MDTIELVFQLEENFNIQISDDDLMDLKTVDDVVQYIEKMRYQSWTGRLENKHKITRRNGVFRME